MKNKSMSLRNGRPSLLSATRKAVTQKCEEATYDESGSDDGHQQEPQQKMTLLPNKLLTFPNPDKDFHETWYHGRDLCNPPHPFRIILAGPPNSGKSTCIKNMIIRADPSFEQIVIISIDPSYSKEYDDIEHVALDKIPDPSDFPGDKKMLVVIDDMDYGNSNKKQNYNLNRLFGYVSTHKNVSVMMAVQDCIACPISSSFHGHRMSLQLPTSLNVRV
jgi:hypothetical protein